MRVTGEATLHAPPQRVWDALLDPAVLVHTIPGCHQLAKVGNDEYRATVTAGVASIKGTFAGSVRLTDLQPPSSLVLHAGGSGTPGTVQADVRLALTDDGAGATRVAYDADAVVGGPVGGVGQRVLTSVARKTADQFFRAVDQALTAPDVPVGTEEVTASPSAPLTGPVTFTRPRRELLPVDARPLVLAAAAGAAIALAGVAVGAALGRRG